MYTESQMIDFAAVSAFLGANLVIVAVIGVLMLIATWCIFNKAGEAGWKCLIPFYGAHVFARIAWKASYFWYTLIICSVLGVIATSANLVWLNLIASIIMLVYAVYACIHLAKRFGKSGGFAVGLVLLSVIFMCILGFGSADYDISRDN